MFEDSNAVLLFSFEFHDACFEDFVRLAIYDGIGLSHTRAEAMRVHLQCLFRRNNTTTLRCKVLLMYPTHSPPICLSRFCFVQIKELKGIASHG